MRIIYRTSISVDVGVSAASSAVPPASFSVSSAASLSSSLTDCNFASNLSASNHPLTREPSSKNIAGVPCTPKSSPNSSKPSIGLSQVTSAGSFSLSIQSDHACAASSAHQTCSAIVRESGAKIGNIKVYTVKLSNSAKVSCKRLQYTQLGSSKTTICRLPSPLTCFTACFKGKLAKSTRFNSSIRCAVKSVKVDTSTNAPWSTKSKPALV